MKFWNYAVIITGLSVLLLMSGITISGLQPILDLIGVTLDSTGLIDFNLSNSSFYLSIFGAAGIFASIIGAVIIGSFTRTSPENYVVLPIITGVFYLFGASLVAIVNYSIQESSVISSIVGLLLIPLGIGFYISCIDYFRGVN